MPQVKYKRVLLKLSGEALSGEAPYGIDTPTLVWIAKQIKQVSSMGVGVSIVVGGGNIWRGDRGMGKTFDRVTSDHIGMLATVINGLMLQAMLGQRGIRARMESAIGIEHVCEPYNLRRAIHFWTPESPLILAAGTGNPYFTTDTAAALRAIELGVDIFLKATKVDGVYSEDPLQNPQAQRYLHLAYQTVLEKGLGIMDGAAISLCRENHLPILVFDMYKRGNIVSAIQGKDVGTIISD